MTATNTLSSAEPTGSPLNVQITALTSEHLLVTYSPPAINQQNGVILSYTVEFGDNLVTTTDVEVPTSSGLFYRISEATPYTDYHARVAASTSVGRGPFSDWVAATTLVAGETSPLLNLFWCEFPTIANIDDIVTVFILLYK